MRRILPPVLLLLLLLALARWAVPPLPPDSSPEEAAGSGAVALPGKSVEPVATNPTDEDETPFYTQARAYRMVLDESGRCVLETVEELTGDFRRPRAMKRLPGMFCCRLLDAAGRLLEQTTMEAPDQVCVVLDPMVLDDTGSAKPTRMTPEGPVVFQVRLPKVEGAEVLEIIRLAGTGSATANERPLGQLVASLSLTP